ncbi:hypothetical protein [Palleronia caenipelagi]|uniref:Uncharacterized protein n=1 Tax=Palleronia caenipelagi TaxID=2489174 RepID=A0A547PY18_9RHOB|nr:hypothetical protein [Palleronia caenipelagi]TRD19045.1 hypothetical protein FEV53_11175 [Palleronia caenipelagi]
MKALLTSLVLGSLSGAPALAGSLCGVPEAEVLDQITGEWEGAERLALDNEVTSLISETSLAVTLRPGAYVSGLTDSLTGTPASLTAATERYDVDAVDEALDAADHAVLADLVSDTPCGPEDLPQFTVTLPETPGMSASGTITLIAYFTDRILHLSDLTLRSDETVLFGTGSALLTPVQ